ncbi:type II toxin-antitoxin system HicB family antitoxin [Phragmitibacter flavus]|uniref:Type II toxin-antitoxin system HicB family antitoxin n=1 Tax=Phragmitibacter flavus TaxID=2576071 RepID=A0A5R8K976_9BACT|nr:type II toxin-antitoxin system HicB family antitoxin [Phragmitibacter flavus]TLD68841.1 type II toxin-antitoxin system HicB family antitoxin [Phragmitibacter flavus]
MNPSASITYWNDDELWLGFLDEFPDYVTQGTSFEDLKEHLLDLHKELTGGLVPNIKRHAQLELA